MTRGLTSEAVPHTSCSSNPETCGFTPQLVAIHVASLLQLTFSDIFNSMEWKGLIEQVNGAKGLNANAKLVASPEWLERVGHFKKSCGAQNNGWDSIIAARMATTATPAATPAGGTAATSPEAITTLQSEWTKDSTMLLNAPDDQRMYPPRAMVLYDEATYPNDPIWKDSQDDYVAGINTLYHAVTGGSEVVKFTAGGTTGTTPAAGTPAAGAATPAATATNTGNITVTAALAAMEAAGFFKATDSSGLAPGFFFIHNAPSLDTGTASDFRQCYNMGLGDLNTSQVSFNRKCAGGLFNSAVNAVFSSRYYDPTNQMSYFKALAASSDGGGQTAVSGISAQGTMWAGLLTPGFLTSDVFVKMPVGVVTYGISDPTDTDGKITANALPTMDCAKEGNQLIDEGLNWTLGNAGRAKALEPLRKLLVTTTPREIPLKPAGQTKTLTMNMIFNSNDIVTDDSLNGASTAGSSTDLTTAQSVIDAYDRAETDKANNLHRALTNQERYQVLLKLMIDSITASSGILREARADEVKATDATQTVSVVGSDAITAVGGFGSKVFGSLLTGIGAAFTGPLAAGIVYFLSILVDMALLALIVMTPILFFIGLAMPGAAAGLLTIAVMGAFILKIVPITLLVLNNIGGMVYTMIGASGASNSGVMQDMMIIAMGGLYANIVGMTFFLLFKLGDPAAVLSRFTALDSSAKEVAKRGLDTAIAAATIAATPFVAGGLGVAGGMSLKSAAMKGLSRVLPADAMKALEHQMGEGTGTKKMDADKIKTYDKEQQDLLNDPRAQGLYDEALGMGLSEDQAMDLVAFGSDDPENPNSSVAGFRMDPASRFKDSWALENINPIGPMTQEQYAAQSGKPQSQEMMDAIAAADVNVGNGAIEILEARAKLDPIGVLTKDQYERDRDSLRPKSNEMIEAVLAADSNPGNNWQGPIGPLTEKRQEEQNQIPQSPDMARAIAAADYNPGNPMPNPIGPVTKEISDAQRGRAQSAEMIQAMEAADLNPGNPKPIPPEAGGNNSGGGGNNSLPGGGSGGPVNVNVVSGTLGSVTEIGNVKGITGATESIREIQGGGGDGGNEPTTPADQRNTDQTAPSGGGGGTSGDGQGRTTPDRLTEMRQENDNMNMLREADSLKQQAQMAVESTRLSPDARRDALKTIAAVNQAKTMDDVKAAQVLLNTTLKTEGVSMSAIQADNADARNIDDQIARQLTELQPAMKIIQGKETKSKELRDANAGKVSDREIEQMISKAGYDLTDQEREDRARHDALTKMNGVAVVSGEKAKQWGAVQQFEAAKRMRGNADQVPGKLMNFASGFYGSISGTGGGLARIPILGPAIAESLNEVHQAPERARAWNSHGYGEWSRMRGLAKRNAFFQQELAPMAAGSQYQAMQSQGAFQVQTDLARQTANEAVARSRSQFEAMVASRKGTLTGDIRTQITTEESAKSASDRMSQQDVEKEISRRVESSMFMAPTTDKRTGEVTQQLRADFRNYMTAGELYGIDRIAAADRISSVRQEAAVAQHASVQVTGAKGGLDEKMMFKMGPNGKLDIAVGEASVMLTAESLNNIRGDMSTKKASGTIDDMMATHYGLMEKQFLRGSKEWDATRHMNENTAAAAMFARKDVSTDYQVAGHLKMVEGKNAFMDRKGQYETLVNFRNEDNQLKDERIRDLIRKNGGYENVLKASGYKFQASSNPRLRMNEREALDSFAKKSLENAPGKNMMKLEAVFAEAYSNGLKKYVEKAYIAPFNLKAHDVKIDDAVNKAAASRLKGLAGLDRGASKAQMLNTGGYRQSLDEATSLLPDVMLRIMGNKYEAMGGVMNKVFEALEKDAKKIVAETADIGIDGKTKHAYQGIGKRAYDEIMSGLDAESQSRMKNYFKPSKSKDGSDIYTYAELELSPDGSVKRRD